jgi:Sporulation related domain.
MLRFLLLFLVCLNIIAFFARDHGKQVFDPLPPPLAADHIMLVHDDDEPNSESPNEVANAVTSAPDDPDAPACIEWGPVNENQINNAEAALSNLGVRTYREMLRVVQPTSWWVNIDGFVSRQNADEAATALKDRGAADISVLEVQGSFVLSLGVFSAEEGAQKRLAELSGTGIGNIQITPRGTSAAFFQIDDALPELVESLIEIASRFQNSHVQTIECRDSETP